MSAAPHPRRPRAAPARAGVLALALAACGTAGPPPVTYVLGASPPDVAGAEPLVGRPVVEVKPVLVPDYLDVTDILRRDGNVVEPSPNARWGERLSVGVTRALTRALARRLPGHIVLAIEPVERPARQVLAEVEAFESRPGGPVILVARWRVLDGGGNDVLAGERVSLVEPVQGGGDPATVAAMSRAVEALAERVASGLRRTTQAARSRR